MAFACSRRAWWSHGVQETVRFYVARNMSMPRTNITTDTIGASQAARIHAILPFSPQADALEGASMKANAMSPAAASAVHVLAVDDDASMRQMIADYLGDNDIQVSTLDSGRDIAAIMDRESIDLVILDLKLPGED